MKRIDMSDHYSVTTINEGRRHTTIYRTYNRFYGTDNRDIETTYDRSFGETLGSVWDILLAIISPIATLILCVVCYCFLAERSFDLDNAVMQIADGQWNLLDWSALTSAINSLIIADPSSWGAFEGFADFLNVVLSVFRGFGYVAGSIIYCFGFILQLLGVLIGW